VRCTRRRVETHAQSAHDCRRDADEIPHYGPSRQSTAQHRAHSEPWTVQHNRAPVATPSACFLNLVSAVRSSPGAPLLACTGRFPEMLRCPNSLWIAVGADNCRQARDYTRT